jgi:hypothetical protein
VFGDFGDEDVVVVFSEGDGVSGNFVVHFNVLFELSNFVDERLFLLS